MHPGAGKTEFDTFDLLFVNAGFSIPTPLDSVTEAIYDEMFNLNAGPYGYMNDRITRLEEKVRRYETVGLGQEPAEKNAGGFE